MKTQTDRATVTVQEAIFSREDRDTREGKYGPEVRLEVLCTDRISYWLWFPVKHIQYGPENRMYCPQWLVDRKNKYLSKRGLVFARIKTVNGQ